MAEILKNDNDTVLEKLILCDNEISLERGSSLEDVVIAKKFAACILAAHEVVMGWICGKLSATFAKQLPNADIVDSKICTIVLVVQQFAKYRPTLLHFTLQHFITTFRCYSH